MSSAGQKVADRAAAALETSNTLEEQIHYFCVYLDCAPVLIDSDANTFRYKSSNIVRTTECPTFHWYLGYKYFIPFAVLRILNTLYVLIFTIK
jgi:hypothetical protein